MTGFFHLFLLVFFFSSFLIIISIALSLHVHHSFTYVVFDVIVFTRRKFTLRSDARGVGGRATNIHNKLSTHLIPFFPSFLLREASTFFGYRASNDDFNFHIATAAFYVTFLPNFRTLFEHVRKHLFLFISLLVFSFAS